MPKFEIYNDSKGKFRYRLIADNNQEICTSGPYATLKTVTDGVDALSRNAAEAVKDGKITDRTDKVLKEEAKAEKEAAKAKEKAKKEAEAKRQADVKAKEKAKIEAEEKKAKAAKPAAKPAAKAKTTKK